MTNQIEQALKHLEKWLNDNDKTKLNEWRSHMVKEAFIGGYKSALEALDKCEPVAWKYKTNKVHTWITEVKPPDDAYDDGTLTPLYTSPQKQQWVGLSDDDIRKVFRELKWTANRVDFEDARAIEAKLKQLNTKG